MSTTVYFVVFQIIFIIITSTFIIRWKVRVKNVIVDKAMLLVNNKTCRTISEYWNVSSDRVNEMAGDMLAMIRMNRYNQVQLFDYVLANYSNTDILVGLYLAGYVYANEQADKEVEAKIVSMQATALMLREVEEFKAKDYTNKAKILAILRLIKDLTIKDFDKLDMSAETVVHLGTAPIINEQQQSASA